MSIHCIPVAWIMSRSVETASVFPLRSLALRTPSVLLTTRCAIGDCAEYVAPQATSESGRPRTWAEDIEPLLVTPQSIAPPSIPCVTEPPFGNMLRSTLSPACRKNPFS